MREISLISDSVCFTFYSTEVALRKGPHRCLGTAFYVRILWAASIKIDSDWYKNGWLYGHLSISENQIISKIIF